MRKAILLAIILPAIIVASVYAAKPALPEPTYSVAFFPRPYMKLGYVYGCTYRDTTYKVNLGSPDGVAVFNLPAGVNVVAVSCPGYERALVTVDVQPVDWTQKAEFWMYPN